MISPLFIRDTLVIGTTLLLGSTGEILTEKSGHLNLGTPGIMAMGGLSGVVGAYFYEKAVTEINLFLAVVITLLAALLGSFLTTLIYAFLTITLRANQNVTGLALTTFGTGLSNFVGGIINKMKGTGDATAAFTEFGAAYQTPLPFSDKLGKFGDAVMDLGFLSYLAIVIAIIVAIVMLKTRVGLNLRAVGENPATADAAGINITKYKYLSVLIGGMISGLGGLHYVMTYVRGNWTANILGQLGWLSVALVIFAMWKPHIGIFGSIVFGALYISGLGTYIGKGIASDQQELLTMLPYVVTVIVLVFTSMRKKKENQPPQSLGTPYFREER